MDYWPQLRYYAFSLYENSLGDLDLYVAVVLVLAIARHVYVHRKMRRMRAALPLLMDGWGTRGKSGTGRIKAAR
jgi:hypothetical protein